MFSDYLYTFLWSVTPFLELRASIPLGVFQFGLSIYEAFVVSVLGGIFTAATVLFFLPIFVDFFERHIPLFDRIMKKIFEKTRSKHSHKMEVVGDIFLVLFVAIPLPGSGAWSGVLISYLFGVPYRTAVFLISLGVILSGIAISLMTVFGGQAWELAQNIF